MSFCILSLNLCSGSNGVWSLKCTRQLGGSRGLEYAAIEPDCQAIYVASETEFVFTKDSERPIEVNENLEVIGELFDLLIQFL